MAKIIRIKNCLLCPTHGGRRTCALTWKKIDDVQIIPDWCPRPDAEEECEHEPMGSK